MHRGQTLIFLLVFIAMSVIISTAAIVVMIANSRSASALESMSATLAVTESGVENALMRRLRNPGYTGETLTVGDGLATITVTGSDPFNIGATGTLGDYTRSISVVAGYNGGILTVTSWSEVFP